MLQAGLKYQAAEGIHAMCWACLPCEEPICCQGQLHASCMTCSFCDAACTDTLVDRSGGVNAKLLKRRQHIEELNRVQSLLGKLQVSQHDRYTVLA